jgi:hypothetical protein
MPWGIRTAATRSRSDRQEKLHAKVLPLENLVPVSRFALSRRNLSKALLLRVAILYHRLIRGLFKFKFLLKMRKAKSIIYRLVYRFPKDFLILGLANGL